MNKRRLFDGTAHAVAGSQEVSVVWMTMTTLAMAGAVPVSQGFEVALSGSVDCDAAVRLQAAMDAPVAMLPERLSQAALCNRTGLYPGQLLALHHRVAEAVTFHRHDPDALIDLWSGVATLRLGLVGDAVRLVAANEVWAALSEHPNGLWLYEASVLMDAEPGPQPAQDAVAFQESLWAQGVSVQTLPYMMALPLHRWAGRSARRALLQPNPRPSLEAQEASWWTVASAHGVARVTADLHDDYILLRYRVTSRLEGARPATRTGSGLPVPVAQ